MDIIKVYGSLCKRAAEIGKGEESAGGWDKPSVGGALAAAATGAVLNPALFAAGAIAGELGADKMGDAIRGITSGTLNDSHRNRLTEKYKRAADAEFERLKRKGAIKGIAPGREAAAKLRFHDKYISSRIANRLVGSGIMLGTSLYGGKKLYNYLTRNRGQEDA